MLLPPAYVVQRKGNIFGLFVCPMPGGGGRERVTPSFVTGLSQGCHGTGKTGNLKVPFPDSENTENLLKNIKTYFYTEFTTSTGNS